MIEQRWKRAVASQVLGTVFEQLEALKSLHRSFARLLHYRNYRTGNMCQERLQNEMINTRRRIKGLVNSMNTFE